MKLLEKYDTAAPRYTSYPTVPYWNTVGFIKEEWASRFQAAFTTANSATGIALYIHLPFCEQLCTYCGCNKYITKNHGYEAPYIDTLLKEWALYRQLFSETPRIRELHLGGGTPTFFSAANLRRLLEQIFSTATLLPDADLSFEGHPNNTTEEHLQTLHYLGFRRMSLGIQDLNPEIQTIIHRIQPFENVERAVTTARQTGYQSVNFDLIYGLPLQTTASIQNTISQVMQLRPDRISFYGYAHVPWIKGNGQRLFSEKDLPQGADKLALYQTGRSLLEQYGYTEIGMDHFALPGDPLYQAWQQGRLHRNFMGYTVSHTGMLVGLGVSAISDGQSVYTQNEKTLAAYQESVQAGKLPIAKGHLLSSEDLLLRKHIRDLMCSFRTGWDKKDVQCAAVMECLQRLQEPEKDGLVAVLRNGVEVTEKGRPYIRNICMAFDAQLWRNTPQAKLFSSAI
ncbi:oxygen-independent coproporphyrinogen III oxidase [Chitinophaga sp. YIM B06452]|uniref:oxygen-independent coproporphyrinogen III oxidase n=1 Tax=Chitinophaga sp. YIM B06452 TaxID=3082158 RepID=UPI0031FF25AC